MVPRFAAAAALLAAGCAAQLPPAPSIESAAVALRPASAPAPPRRGEFPSTVSGVHLNLVFNYDVRDVDREIGRVDVVWGASAPKPPQVYNQYYTPFEREGVYGPVYEHSLAWWKARHPSWIEYRCDRATVAYEYGDAHDVPLDIANPQFRAYQQARSIAPALAAGFNGMAFDNLSLGNFSRRCGHFSGSGRWVAQYTGAWSDPAYQRDVIAWAENTYAFVHGYSATATMAINYSYQSGSSFGQNLALMTATDEVLDERGFTNWGSTPNVAGPAEWRDIMRAIRALQKHGTCYMENGEEPGPSRAIAQAERLWVVGNYLLTRDACTYTWMSGFGSRGQQEYGRMIFFPEYRVNIGTPSAAAVPQGGGWERRYSGGLVVVNPSSRRARFPLAHRYFDENGARYTGSIGLEPGTAQILLTKPN
ncbi:MAG TPA: hypothetical protein VMF61_03485 [Candidatus Acidoferrales bacterium]|nr:hypothetical protein [Candidatus Acidoferrales bacterium]